MKSVIEIGRGLGVVIAALLVGILLYFRPPLSDHVVESGGQSATSTAISVEQSGQSTENILVVEDSDISSNSSASSENNSVAGQGQNVTLNGLDVSHYQGFINWNKVDSSDIDFAYLKASEGINYKDPRFAENVENLKSVDMPVGAYHFFEPADDALIQAKWFVKTISTGMPFPGAVR